jgi:hypothetical protein
MFKVGRPKFDVGRSHLPFQSSSFPSPSSNLRLLDVDSKPPHGFSPCGHVAYAPVQTAYKPSAVFPTFVSSCLRVRSSSAYLLKSQQSNIKYHQSSISSLLALPSIDSGAPPAPSALRATSLCSCPNGLQAFSRFHSSPFTLHFH